jgi:hypothetical protein
VTSHTGFQSEGNEEHCGPLVHPCRAMSIAFACATCLSIRIKACQSQQAESGSFRSDSRIFPDGWNLDGELDRMKMGCQDSGCLVHWFLAMERQPLITELFRSKEFSENYCVLWPVYPIGVIFRMAVYSHFAIIRFKQVSQSIFASPKTRIRKQHELAPTPSSCRAGEIQSKTD